MPALLGLWKIIAGLIGMQETDSAKRSTRRVGKPVLRHAGTQSLHISIAGRESGRGANGQGELAQAWDHDDAPIPGKTEGSTENSADRKCDELMVWRCSGRSAEILPRFRIIR